MTPFDIGHDIVATLFATAQLQIENADLLAFHGQRMTAAEGRDLAIGQHRPAAPVDPGACAICRCRHRIRGRRGCCAGQVLDHFDFHVVKFRAGQWPHWLPWRNTQRDLQKFDTAAHFHGVLRQASDIALNHGKILGGVMGRGRIFAAVAKPYLVHHNQRLAGDVTPFAGKQDERAHRFATGLG